MVVRYYKNVLDFFEKFFINVNIVVVLFWYYIEGLEEFLLMFLYLLSKILLNVYLVIREIWVLEVFKEYIRV